MHDWCLILTATLFLFLWDHFSFLNNPTFSSNVKKMLLMGLVARKISSAGYNVNHVLAIRWCEIGVFRHDTVHQRTSLPVWRVVWFDEGSCFTTFNKLNRRRVPTETTQMNGPAVASPNFKMWCTNQKQNNGLAAWISYSIFTP